MPVRNLTDADVEAIVQRFESHVMDQFYKDLGKGVLRAVRTVVVAVFLALATIGHLKGWWKLS